MLPSFQPARLKRPDAPPSPCSKFSPNPYLTAAAPAHGSHIRHGVCSRHGGKSIPVTPHRAFVPVGQQPNGGYLDVPAPEQVRVNVKETSWLMIDLILAFGIVIGFLLGYWPLRSSQNAMQEQLNRIEQYLTAQQQATPAPAIPDAHALTYKGKAK